MVKLRGKKMISFSIALVLVMAVFTLEFHTFFRYRSMESQLFEFFSISMSESITLHDVGRDEYGVFYAEILVPVDRVEEVFSAYRLASREVDIEYLRPDIRRKLYRLSPRYEMDYFYILFGTLQRGFIFQTRTTQEKHVVFMEENSGVVLVLLFSTHPERGWRAIQ